MKTLDFHSYLGFSIFGYGQTLPELMRRLDENQIDQAVVIGVQSRGYQLGPANDTVAAAVAQYPDRLIGFARVDPRQGQQARDELYRCVDRLGLKGLFLHPWEESCPVNSHWVKGLLPVAETLEIPVMIAGGHVRVSMASQIADLARHFPEQPIVVTSGGQINISGIALAEAETLLREHANLYLETSGIYREDFIEDMVPVIGSERMIFGSGSPEYHQGLEVLRPRLAHLNEKDRANLLYHTAAHLLRLKS